MASTHSETSKTLLKGTTDFEAAFEMTGHGCFNHWVLAASTLIFIHSMLEMVSFGYIITPAECDLHLSVSQKSMINSATFLGVCITSIFSGQLSDRIGRRKIMLPTASGAICCSILSSFCSKFSLMFLFRFMTGCLISATSGVSLVYLGELMTESHKDKAITILFSITQLSFVILPGFAFLILPRTWSLNFLNIFIRPWRTFIWLWEFIGFTGAMILYFLPESPRFIAAKSGSEKALPILANMYAWNHRKTVDDYPVSSITAAVATNKEQRITLKAKLIVVMKEFLVLFKAPMLKCYCLSHFCMFNTFLVANGLYMWLPDFINKGMDHLTDSMSMCGLFKVAYSTLSDSIVSVNKVPWTLQSSQLVPHIECEIVNPNVYPVSSAMELFYMIPCVVVNIMIVKVDKRKLYCIITCISSLFLLLSGTVPKLYLALMSLMIAPITSACVGILTAMAMEAFPTSLRALSIATMYMAGQLGAIVGTSIIAIMAYFSCVYIIVGVSLIETGAALALMYMWPDMAKTRKDMEAKGFAY